ncbi:exported hypothetical protein [Candidatus Sulfotelmatobacter sp. SbA7]|nr:exported hypothetical protein [Candidatus Sulfotelmatobacter sp. SbA7]
MKMRGLMLVCLAIAGLTVLSPLALAQSSTGSNSSSAAVPPATPQPALTYTKPTPTIKFHAYLFDAFGPYPIVGAAIAAGINQADNAPPEWQQGAEGYGKRFGSNFGILAISTSTRYALAAAFHEDTLYYRCECKGFFPRLSHALISTFAARRGEDGHYVFSFPDLVAPYAGTMAGVYAWYPDRYDARDAFRLGNYSLIGYAAENVGLEFIYQGPHSWLSRMHMNNTHSAPDSAQSH